MDVSPLQLTLAVAGSGGSSSALTAFFGFLRQRSSDRLLSRDEVQRAAKELVRTALDSASSQVERLETEVKSVRADVTQMKADHRLEMDEAEKACQARTEALRQEIAHLMSRQSTQPLAPYKPRELKRVKT